MAIQISGTNVIDNNRKGIFQSANVGAFANPGRPGSAATGDLIFSTTDNELQVWDGTQWISAGGTRISATGGTEYTSSDGFTKVHVFTSPGTFTLNTNGAYLETVVVAGGGGGGKNRADTANPYGGFTFGDGGGGGAGGVIYTKSSVWASGSYAVTVGAGGGGTWRGTNGGDTTFQCPPVISAPGTLTAIGGGGGGGYPPLQPSSPGTAGLPGGSGGGGLGGGPGPGGAGAGTAGQGTPGGTGGSSPTSNQASVGGGGGGAASKGYSPGPDGSSGQEAQGGTGLALTWAGFPLGGTEGIYYVGGGGGSPSGGGTLGKGGNGTQAPATVDAGSAGGVVIRYNIIQ